MVTENQEHRINDRLRYWGDAYLQSTQESYRRAKRFFGVEGDSFTAYLYLFVAFNNLYCLLAKFDGREPAKIRAALDLLPQTEVQRVYGSRYVELVRELNDRPTEQFVEGPDAGSTVRGIVNMRDYFLGKSPLDCVAHVTNVAPLHAPTDAKRETLQEVAVTLLYTVRNNQFHAVKGPHRLADQLTLETAYELLQPLVEALIRVAEGSLQPRATS